MVGGKDVHKGNEERWGGLETHVGEGWHAKDLPFHSSLTSGGVASACPLAEVLCLS